MKKALILQDSAVNISFRPAALRRAADAHHWAGYRGLMKSAATGAMFRVVRCCRKTR
jgi:hypothetical protein